MGLVDGIVWGVILLSTLISAVRGIIRECLSLLAWVCIAVLFFISLEPLAQYLLHLHLQSPLNWAMAGLLLWLGVSLVMKVFHASVYRIFSTLGLRWLDHLLGALFGLARGVLLAWLIVWGMVLVLGPDHALLTQATTRYWLNSDQALWKDLPSEQDIVCWVEKWAPGFKDMIEKIQPTSDAVVHNASDVD